MSDEYMEFPKLTKSQLLAWFNDDPFPVVKISVEEVLERWPDR